METTKIAAINGISLTAESVNGETLIPIRPICQALGISFATQRNKIQQDSDLASVVFLGNKTEADGKPIPASTGKLGLSVGTDGKPIPASTGKLGLSVGTDGKPILASVGELCSPTEADGKNCDCTLYRDINII